MLVMTIHNMLFWEVLPPRPTPGPGPEPTPGTDPIENLDISETVGADGTMTITPNGDTSTLDHYNVNVYGEG